MKVTPVRASLLIVGLIATVVVSTSGLGRSIYHRTGVAVHLISTFFVFQYATNSQVVSITAEGTLSRADPASLDADNHVGLTASAAIPKHVHQVKLGSLDMRPTWVEARESCMRLHPSWEFTLWQDEEANAFVQRYYPDLYEMYRQYPLEIQRSNVLRYLLLDQFGGVYLDLDLGCRVPLDDVLSPSQGPAIEFLTPPANPTGVNNAFIASVAHHPFWQHLIDHLPSYDLSWFRSPYITNMMSTGCHFFSTMHRMLPKEKGTLSILDQANKLNGHVTTPLFVHLGASSWHKGDAKAILRMGQAVERVKRHSHILIVFSLVAVSLLILLFVRRYRSHRYLRLDDVEADADTDDEQGKEQDSQRSRNNYSPILKAM